MTTAAKSVLVLVFDGVEEIEALTPVDLLRRAGNSVTLAGIDSAKPITGRNGIVLTPEAEFSVVKDRPFDLFILPGGPGVLPLAEHAALTRYIRSRSEAGLANAAICAAPAVFAAAGILRDLPATAHASVRHQLPNPSDEPVVVQRGLITSQGVGSAIEFSLALVTLLASADTAESIRQSIHA